MGRRLALTLLLAASCDGAAWMLPDRQAVSALAKECRGTCDVCSTLATQDDQIAALQLAVADLGQRISTLEAMVVAR